MPRKDIAALERAEPSSIVAAPVQVVADRIGIQSRTRAGPADAALVMDARSGDRVAMEKLFRRYSPVVRAVANRLLGGDSDHEDLVQESFTQALLSIHRLRSAETFSAWISTIVVRTADKLLRRRRLMTRLGLRRSADIDWDRIRAKQIPADHMMQLSALYGLVTRMPSKLRTPLLLRHVEDAPIDEIARRTGVSQTTVKRRLTKAQTLLDATRAKQDKITTSSRPRPRARAAPPAQ